MNTEERLDRLEAGVIVHGTILAALMKSHPQPKILRAAYEATAKETLAMQTRNGAPAASIESLKSMLEECRVWLPEWE